MMAESENRGSWWGELKMEYAKAADFLSACHPPKTRSDYEDARDEHR